ncbi:hypothetical protein CKAH01_17627 [Colletotrichum kahawae]|uniref:Uncharacterized protein n=1 Tax=Colletotrichum kahawae TaxID=34407 RepID=A0AAD9YBC7_COLKA|nr:hypothetical protein CKAH01_17627 [Colletotrichum kahawae]
MSSAETRPAANSSAGFPPLSFLHVSGALTNENDC